MSLSHPKQQTASNKEFIWQNGAWALTNEVHYIYDGKLVIQERNSNNLATVTYTRGSDLSGTLEGAGGIGGLLARTDHGSLSTDHSYFHADALGNITTLIDTNQQIVARYLYDPFGGMLSMSGPLAEANLYRFSSKEAHIASGLVYYLYRYYHPSFQRWINRDPIVDPAYIAGRRKRSILIKVRNLYFFVSNRPVDRVDSFGLLDLPDFNEMAHAGASKAFGCQKAIKEVADMLGATSNDKRAHCIASCKLAEGCGKGLAKTLGNIKEARDLTFGGIQWGLSWVLPKSAEDWLDDHLQGGNIDASANDFAANNFGLDLADEGQDCVCGCEKEYGADPMTP